MKFANPQFLWALFSIAIPILIHLFHFKRFKTVYFTNVRFLRELKKETQSRSKLRQLLILLFRCLALAALVFAFAQPYFPTPFTSQKGERAISIYIDNSFSMESQGESSSLLELAKKHALDIVKSYKNTDRFQLITNELEARQMQWLTIDQFSERLGDISVSPTITTLDKIILRQQESIKEAQKDGSIYLISDFQRTTSNLEKVKSDTSKAYHFIHLIAGINDNVSIDSVWFESPYREVDEPDNLSFSVQNYSNKRFDNLPVKLRLGNAEKGIESISAGPDSSLNAKLSFSTSTKGFQSGELSLNDFPVTFDDKFYFSYRLPDKINILAINGSEESPFLEQLFSTKSLFNLVNAAETGLDYSSLNSQDLIILNEPLKISSGLVLELEKFVNKGGSLLLFPNLDSSPNDINRLCDAFGATKYRSKITLNQKVASLNIAHPIYSDVFERKQESIDLPSVNEYFKFVTLPNAQEDRLMTLQNGDNFLSSYTIEKGKFYCSAVPLRESASNFPKHAMFIPTLYKVGLYSINAGSLYYTLGVDNAITLGALNQTGDKPLSIKSIQGDFEFIPENRIIDGKVSLFVNKVKLEAGNYKIMQGDSLISYVSFNYNRAESNPSVYTESELTSKINLAGLSKATYTDGSGNDLPGEMLLTDQGKQLWKWFIILALIFLGVETLLIRFMK